MAAAFEVGLLDALTRGNIKDNVNAMSKRRLLKKLSSMSENDLRSIIHAAVNHIEASESKYDGLRRKIAECFGNDNRGDINSANPFISLPSEIGACILSFSNMYDRIKHELICKDLYKFCQVPSARYHLMIDHKFAKGLYSNSVHIRKFFNAQYVEIKYVFKDGHHEKLEGKYYSMTAQILSKSPSLRTLKWELTYKQFRGKLTSQTRAGDWYGYTGHILEWMKNITEKSNESVFRSVKKLIYTPSQHKTDFSLKPPCLWRRKSEFLPQLLPNLSVFCLEKTRAYNTDIANIDDEDFEWRVSSKPRYYNKIEHISYNLVDMSLGNGCWDHNYRRIKVSNHPISHFPNFSKLKSMRFALPIFNGCFSYYSNIAFLIPLKPLLCFNLTEVELKFEYVGEHGEKRSFAGIYESERNTYLKTMDMISNFILMRCPNITKYSFLTCMTHDMSYGKSFKQLIGVYDKIEELYIDTPAIISGDVRMISLRKLTLKLPDADSIKSICSGFDGMPNLSSFKCIFVKRQDKIKCNSDICETFQFLAKRTSITKLKHIGIYHEPSKVNKKYRQNNFDLHLKKEQSLKLCKALISFSVNSNFSIESIVLNPVKLKKKELEYLYFWFNGKIETTNYYTTSDTVLSDLHCYNVQKE